MGENIFKDNKMYRVCDQFVRKNTPSIDYGKRISTLHIQGNQSYSQTISLCPTECLQPGQVDSLFNHLLQNHKFRKRFMDLSNRRLRYRIKLTSWAILKLSNASDNSKDIKKKGCFKWCSDIHWCNQSVLDSDSTETGFEQPDGMSLS